MKTLEDIKYDLLCEFDITEGSETKPVINSIIHFLHAQGLLMVWNTDMDSAPRDGVEFIGWDELNNCPTIAFYNVSDDKYFTGFFHVDDVLGGVKLSAWMPLPRVGG